MVGGSKGGRQDRRSFRPKPDPGEGAAVLSPVIWGEGEIQSLPPPPGTDQ